MAKYLYELPEATTTNSGDYCLLSQTDVAKKIAVQNLVNLSNVAGVLPISKGGTQATTASDALDNLGAVAITTTVNSKPLSANVTLDTDDVAEGSTNKYNVQSDWDSISGLSQILNRPEFPLAITNGGTGTNSAANALINLGAVPTTRTVNGQPLSVDVSLDTDDVTEGTTNKYNVQSDWDGNGLSQVLNRPNFYHQDFVIADWTAGSPDTLTIPALDIEISGSVYMIIQLYNSSTGAIDTTTSIVINQSTGDVELSGAAYDGYIVILGK